MLELGFNAGCSNMPCLMLHALMLLWLLPGLQPCMQQNHWPPLLLFHSAALYLDRGVVPSPIQRGYGMSLHGCGCCSRTWLMGAIQTSHLGG